MYIIKKLLGIAVVLLLVSCNGTMSKLDVANSVTQIQLERIEAMPNFPKPFKILDFKEVAIRFDSLVYDETQTGKYWPLIWKDNSRKNFDQETFGIYTAVGDVRQGIENHNGIFHESLATIGSVLGASLIGIDKSNQKGENYVSMLKNYFNTETGWNIIMNNTCPDVALLGGGYARDWWYDVFPNVLFYALADLYPEEKEYSTIQRTIAEQFYKADSILDGNYSYPFFDYFAMKPKKSSIYHQSETLAYPPSDCFQEDVAAGHAYVLYAAYQKFNDPKYLKGAKSSIEALLGVKKNSFYEVLMPYGAYVAARLNAEEGTDYNYTKILEWTFNGTSLCRKGWGVIVDNWNGYDVSGLIGNTENEGDRVFLMNTYDAMWPLVPMVRYDQKYANIIGKWMLNAANAIKFFYPYEISNDHQLAPELKQHTKGVIAYEGLIKNSTRNYQKKEAPIAFGEGPKWVGGNPNVSQFSVYGSGHVGIAGAIISKTNIENILQLNLLATDFYRKEAYPSYLYYNPNPEDKEVTIYVGENEVKIYDAIKREFISPRAKENFTFKIEKENSAVLVFVPKSTKVEEREGKLYADNVIIDYHYSKINKNE